MFQAAANSLLQRYRSLSPEISNFLRCLLEDETMSRNDIEAVTEFYGDWNSANIVYASTLICSVKEIESSDFSN